MIYRMNLFILMLIFISGGKLLSQTQYRPLLYLSGHTGIYIPASDDFKENYGTDTGFVFGLGFGVPIFSPRIYLFAKASYFSKSNDENVKASLKEWIINGGFKYRFLQSGAYHLYVSAGGTVIAGIREKVEFPDGTGWGLNGSAVGYFLGGGIERSFPGKPVSLFAEAEYNTSWESTVNFKERGGVNVNLGICFYFEGSGSKAK